MKVEWSPDDQFLMMVNTKEHLVYLRSVQDEDWAGTVCEPMLAAAIWSSDSRQIILYSDLQLRVTVWSLVEEAQTAVLQGPKVLPPKGTSFSDNKKFMALLEKRDNKDCVSIYYAGSDWKIMNTFEVNGELIDAQDVKWTMRSTALLVQDSCLESRYVVYSALTGQVLARHCPSDPKQGLGIRQLTVSPSNKIVACGLFQPQLALFNNLTQKDLARLHHPIQIQLAAQRNANQPTVYREEKQKADVSRLQNGMASAIGYQYVNMVQTISDGKITVKVPQVAKKDMQQFHTSTYEKVGLKGPPIGIQLMEWSFDSQYLATKCEEMPNAVWIWDVTTLKLTSVLLHIDVVRAFKFAPSSHSLYICTGQKRLFVWGGSGACVIELPETEL